MKKIILSIIAGVSALGLLQNANAYFRVKNDTGRTIFISYPHEVGGERLFPGQACDISDRAFNVKVAKHTHHGYGFRLVTACTINPRPSFETMTTVRVVDVKPFFNGGCYSFYPW